MTTDEVQDSRLVEVYTVWMPPSCFLSVLRSDGHYKQLKLLKAVTGDSRLLRSFFYNQL